jgi:hypothetical protein
MSRLLFAVCLSLFAAAAFAGETPATDDDAAAAKSGKSTAATTTPDADAPVTHPASTAPARVASAHPSRRWHSLLPGMIR